MLRKQFLRDFYHDTIQKIASKQYVTGRYVANVMATLKEFLTSVPLPPQPVISRWGTCIDAVVYLPEHCTELKEIIEHFDSCCRTFIDTWYELLSDQQTK